MNWILNAIISTIPASLGPILTVSILSNYKVKKVLKTPIDFGRNFIDGKRIFGDNKTWKGIFFAITIFTLVSVVWGFVCKYIPVIGSRNWLYINNKNTVSFNAFFGAILGLVHSLFELPNSFLKRRCNVAPGKSNNEVGKKRILFFLLDQFDSEIGAMLLFWYFARMNFIEYIQIVLLAGFLHYLSVKIMCKLKLKEAI